VRRPAGAGLTLLYGRRVHTLGLPVAAKLMYVFKGADLDTQITTLARSVAAKVRLSAAAPRAAPGEPGSARALPRIAPCYCAARVADTLPYGRAPASRPGRISDGPCAKSQLRQGGPKGAQLRITAATGARSEPVFRFQALSLALARGLTRWPFCTNALSKHASIARADDSPAGAPRSCPAAAWRPRARR